MTDGPHDQDYSFMVQWMDEERFWMGGGADYEAERGLAGEASLIVRVDEEVVVENLVFAGSIAIDEEILFETDFSVTYDRELQFEVTAEADVSSHDDKMAGWAAAPPRRASGKRPELRCRRRLRRRSRYANAAVLTADHSEVLKFTGTVSTTGDMSEMVDETACLSLDMDMGVNGMPGAVGALDGSMGMGVTVYAENLVTESMDMDLKRVDVSMEGQNEDIFPALGLEEQMDSTMSRPARKSTTETGAPEVFSSGSTSAAS